MTDEINQHFVDEDPLAPSDRKKEKILDPLATMFAIQSLLPKYHWNNKQKATASHTTLPKERRVGWRPNRLWNRGPNGVRLTKRHHIQLPSVASAPGSPKIKTELPPSPEIIGYLNMF